MNNHIWQSIAETPWWVYAAFCSLVYFGVLASKPRVITLKSLYIYPVFFIFFSLFLLGFKNHFTLEHILLWLGASGVGFIAGRLQLQVLKIKALRHQNKFQIPGSWFFLILVLCIFTLRFYIAFYLQVDFVTFFNRPENINLVFALYGLFAGIFIGRLHYAFRCLKIGPFVE